MTTNQTPSSGEMLPCPFCGSHRIAKRGHCLECNDCGASGPEFPNDATVYEVERRWNTRHVPTHPETEPTTNRGEISSKLVDAEAMEEIAAKLSGPTGKISLRTLDAAAAILRQQAQAVRGEAGGVSVDDLVRLLPGPYYMDPPDGGDVSLHEQLKRMAKDAERYRWLRSNAGFNEFLSYAGGGSYQIDQEFDLDDAIDDAINRAEVDRG